MIGNCFVCASKFVRMAVRSSPPQRIGTTVDFCALANRPEVSPKFRRSLDNAVTSFWVGFTKIAVSSAYRDTSSVGVLPRSFPKQPELAAKSRSFWRGSIEMTKRSGDSGSPW